MVPMTILALIMAAPVLPAVTRAWARPSLTSSAQRRIEERPLLADGGDGGLVHAHHLLGVDDLDARRHAMPTLGTELEAGERRPRSAARSPTRRIEAPSSRAERTAPSTAHCGAKSPPMASTAMRSMIG